MRGNVDYLEETSTNFTRLDGAADLADREFRKPQGHDANTRVAGG
jgi:hypothetical protein